MKSFKELFFIYFKDTVYWTIPIIFVITLYRVYNSWPVDWNNFLNLHVTWIEFIQLVFSLPVLNGVTQGLYVYLMQQKPGYLERQQKDKEAADKWKADMAAKRAKYGRWWWLRRHKK